MRTRSLLPLLLSIAVTPALASFNEKPQAPPPSSSSGNVPAANGEVKPARAQAEIWYHDAYEDVTKAKEVLAAEKPDAKKAKKLYERAIERAGRALDYDPKYHEALNLQGFAWRSLKNYEKSLAAYAACIALAPDYAPAREYYGQALLESGNRKGAEDQLVFLKKLNSEEHVKLLEAALAATPVKTEEKAAVTPSTGGH
jgi:tetratricopeptide (TPR) repeat protein